MKKLNDRITAVTNIFLACVFLVVCAFTLVPEPIVPISANNGATAIYAGNREKDRVSLMFNVYEGSDVVSGILDLLKEEGARATFFVGGCWADDNKDLLVRIVGEGHEIANHGYFHKDHKKLDYKGNEQEIYLCGKIIEAYTGVTPTLFAPPSGSFSETTLEVANDLGYKVIMWSKDTIDWRDKDKDLIIKRATKEVRGGDLILMHPKAHTLGALKEVISIYKKIGLKVVTVSENLA
jgi:peptidoglycan/xylan/chitin deacetylase (PgdA/CDA1 family)